MTSVRSPSWRACSSSRPSTPGRVTTSIRRAATAQSPSVALHGLGAVGRVERDRLGERLDAARAVLDDDLVVEDDELGPLSLELGRERLRCRPTRAAGARRGCPPCPTAARVSSPPSNEARLAREPLVERPASEDHAPLRSARRRGSWRRLSWYSFTSRRSLSVRPSIDARMSLVAARARSGCPFVKTVASATWLSRIDGFFSDC